ncbi:MAG: JAB domain-containing protein [Mycobacteriales bacterium]
MTKYPHFQGMPAPVASDVGAEEPALRVRKDAAEMTTEELFTELLGRQNARACATIAGNTRSLREIAAVHPLDWRDAGLSAAVTDRLAALFELAKRYGETEWTVGAKFSGSHDVYAHFRERLAAETREHFYTVLLDNKNRKIRDVLISLGSLTATVIHPRDVFSRVICDAAASVIFLHNHPSGDPTPSAEDLEITRRLRQTGDALGVRVLDHLVIGKGRFVSFVDDGYW